MNASFNRCKPWSNNLRKVAWILPVNRDWCLVHTIYVYECHLLQEPLDCSKLKNLNPLKNSLTLWAKLQRIQLLSWGLLGPLRTLSKGFGHVSKSLRFNMILKGYKSPGIIFTSSDIIFRINNKKVKTTTNFQTSTRNYL